MKVSSIELANSFLWKDVKGCLDDTWPKSKVFKKLLVDVNNPNIRSNSGVDGADLASNLMKSFLWDSVDSTDIYVRIHCMYHCTGEMWQTLRMY